MALMNNEYAYFSSFFEKKIKKKKTPVCMKKREDLLMEREVLHPKNKALSPKFFTSNII